MQANKGDLAAVVHILMRQSTICLVYTLQMTGCMPPWLRASKEKE
jgi:hypothetical protein